MEGTRVALELFFGIVGGLLIWLAMWWLFKRFPKLWRGFDAWMRLTWNPVAILVVLAIVIGLPLSAGQPVSWPPVVILAGCLGVSLVMRWEKSRPGTAADRKRIRPHRPW